MLCSASAAFGGAKNKQGVNRDSSLLSSFPLAFPFPCELKTTETCPALHQFVVHIELLALPPGEHSHLPNPLIRKKLSSKNRLGMLENCNPSALQLWL